MPGPGDDDEPIGFELSEEDLEAIADQPSELVPDEPSPTETPYTIRNAPVAKSILPPEAFLRELEPAEDEGREDDRGESTDDDEP